MFVIVARSGTLNVLTPSPKYSTAQPTLPLLPNMLKTFRITSLAETHGFNDPVSLMPQTFG